MLAPSTVLCRQLGPSRQVANLPLGAPGYFELNAVLLRIDFRIGDQPIAKKCRLASGSTTSKPRLHVSETVAGIEAGQLRSAKNKVCVDLSTRPDPALAAPG